MYLIGVAAISYIFFNRIHLTKFIFHIIIFTLIFLSGGVLGYIPGISLMIVYYVIAATSEEILKFFIGYHFSEHFEISANDIILFSILSGIGFCFVENIVYAFTQSQSLIGSIGIVLQRGLINFLMHALFTGIIGYGIYEGYKSE